MNIGKTIRIWTEPEPIRVPRIAAPVKAPVTTPEPERTPVPVKVGLQ